MTELNDELIVGGNDQLRRSVQLLLLLSRTEFSGEEKRQIAGEFEIFTSWKLFAYLAVRHGVAALVWQNITDLELSAKVPETERTLLEGLRFKSIARVAWISETAAGVCTLLEKEGIRVVLLKGLALEHTVYGSRGLRQMSDADLLVAPSDALRARDILVSDGFRSMPLKSPLYKHIILDLGNHLPELHRGGISVDLHYRLFGPEAVASVASAIAEAETIVAGNERFRILPPVTSFLALVSHIYKHEVKGEFQLRLWVDIYLLLRKSGNSILTGELPAAAEEAGIAKEMETVLTVMEKVWGVNIPPELRVRPENSETQGGRGAIRDGRNKAVSEDAALRRGREMVPAVAQDDRTYDGEAKAGSFMHDLMHPGSVVPLSQREMFKRNLKALKSPGKKLIFVLGDIFPSIGFMKHRYGCRSPLKAMLFYPHRLGKLAWVLGLPGANNRDI